MKINIKKLAIISSLPIFVLLLSGCGSPVAKTPLAPAPRELTQADLPTTTDNSQALQSTPAITLEPLPEDNKVAVDSEISSIDKELQTTENAINSADLSDADLGL